MGEEIELLTSQEVQVITKLAANTLANWRCCSEKRKLLPFIKIGRRVRYRKSDVLKFIAELPRGGE